MSRCVSAGCFAALLLSCFGGVLLRDRRFSYRDGAEFHEPLARLARQEWLTGRWPLWDPTVNGGTPLLGNPAAAVLYPGKLLELLPMPWGGHLYVVGHVVLAFLAARAMLRDGGVSRDGAHLGALAYAFGTPVLFQYSNVIYLIGAAWAPLGFRAIDRLVRLNRRGAVAELATVLALIGLGGDPETAYLLVAIGVAYALGLACRPWPAGLHVPGGRLATVGLLVAGLIGWVGLTLLAAGRVKQGRWWFPIPAEGPYPVWYQVGLAACWGGVAVWWVRRAKGMKGARPLAGLAVAVVLALAIGALAFWPALEFSRLSVRSAEGSTHAIYSFSVEPYRVVEWLWPGVFGPFPRVERQWLHLLPPEHVVQTWTPSLYLGGLTLVLAVAGATGRDWNAPWRLGLTAVGVVSVLGALGEYGSPVWWARAWPGTEEWLGLHDAGLAGAGRLDGGVSDGTGGVYWLLAAALPGFDVFRYPGKLLTFTSLALAGLAGAGWDRIGEEQESGRAAKGARMVLIASVVVLALAFLTRGPIVAWLGRAGGASPTPLGQFDPAGAWTSAVGALGQAVVVSALALGLIRAAARRERWAGPAAMAVLTLDLALANAGMVVSAPGEVFETPPAVVRLIEEAERREPSPGPFRVHRLSTWFPAEGFGRAGTDPLLALTRWELDTAKPRFATRWGLSYTLAGGGLELADYGALLGGLYLPLDVSKAPLRGAVDGQPVLYYTRRGYDLWGTRYFILPMEPNGWQDATRAVAAFLAAGDTLAPDPALMARPENAEKLADYVRTQDWMLLRNREAYPRAWVVHRARFEKPIGPGDAERRERMMEQILYPDDPIWSRPNLRVYDPRTLAWVETDDPKPLATYAPGPDPASDARESVSVARHQPTRVEVEARLDRPGLVVLADVFYPGWTLTIDGRPAEILRVNRLMRGAAVGAGTHRLVYTYRPDWFIPCAAISLAGTVATLAWLLATGLRPGKSVA